MGLTERQVQEQGLPYLVGKRDYSATAYGWAIGDTESFVKLIAHAETRQVLGRISSGRTPPSCAAARQRHALWETIDQLAHDTFYIHPALTEVVEQALLEIAPPAAQ